MAKPPLKITQQLAAIGGAIWDHWYLACAIMFAAFAVLEIGNSSRAIGDLMLGAWAFIAWLRDRDAKQWERGYDDLRWAFERLLAQRPTHTIQWSDFRQRVEDFMPEDQREAVRSALDCAIAPDLHEVH